MTRILIVAALGIVFAAPGARAGSYALVDPVNNCTVSVIAWDGSSAFTPPAGLTVVAQGSAPAMCPPPPNPTIVSGAAFGANIFTGTQTVPSLDASATVKTGGYTVGTLPSGTTGMRAYVTDQTTACPLAGAALTGSGGVTCPVFYNGSAWVGD